jgi:hypothetical protein
LGPFAALQLCSTVLQSVIFLTDFWVVKSESELHEIQGPEKALLLDWEDIQGVLARQEKQK